MRSIHISIFLNTITDQDKIFRAIKEFYTTAVSLDALQKLAVIKPTVNECELLKNGNLNTLNDEERFLMKVMAIPDYSKKIDLLIYFVNSKEDFDMVSNKSDAVIVFCQSLIEKQDLQLLFDIIKVFTKTMTGFNDKSGIFANLWKLKGIKSVDKKVTLLEYIIKSYMDTMQKNSAKLCSPISSGIITEIKKASTIDLKNVKIQIDKLQKEFEGKI